MSLAPVPSEVVAADAASAYSLVCEQRAPDASVHDLASFLLLLHDSKRADSK
jgi:hypothetical protein